MITDVTYPNKHCFTGNPILVKVQANTTDDINLKLKVDTEPEIVLTITPYTPVYTPLSEGTFDISDILDTYFKKVSITEGSLITLAHDFRIEYTVTVDGYSGSSFEGYAYRGGINNKNYSLLESWGWDMFRYRLDSPDRRQFLFSTRTNSNQIRLRERELYPFVFIHPGTPISFVTSNGRIITYPALVKGNTCTMDFETLRNMFVSLYNELPSFISVLIDGKSFFNVTITPAQIAEEHVILRFKNSLGAYEQIEVTGAAVRTSQFSEENTWLSPHRDGYYEELRDRLTTKEGVTVQTGYKSKDELAFIKDLLKSDEIYYIDPVAIYNQKSNRCHVTTEKYEYTKRNASPESIPLKIRFITEDIFESPDIILDYAKSVFENITAQGKPEINGEGFIYDDDYMFYAE